MRQTKIKRKLNEFESKLMFIKAQLKAEIENITNKSID